MTLDNLIGKSLERIEPDSAAIQRLLEAAQRNLKDAELTGLLQARYLLATITTWLGSEK